MQLSGLRFAGLWRRATSQESGWSSKEPKTAEWYVQCDIQSTREVTRGTTAEAPQSRKGTRHGWCGILHNTPGTCIDHSKRDETLSVANAVLNPYLFCEREPNASARVGPQQADKTTSLFPGTMAAAAAPVSCV